MAYIELVNLAHPTTNPPNFRIQFNDRPGNAIMDPDALLNWSTQGSPQRGWTKHHQVPWEVIRRIFNKALLDLQEKKNGDLWDAIRKAAFVGGNVGTQKLAVENAKKALSGLSILWQAPLAPGAAAPAVPAVNAVLGNRRTTDVNSAGVMPAVVNLVGHTAGIEHLASRFCWMPGNMFLGPTPGSRLDNPPAGSHGFEGFDAPPKGKGGEITTLLNALYDAAVLATPNWSDIAELLGKLAKVGVAKSGKLVHMVADDWKVDLLPGTAVNVYKKKIA